VVAEIVHGAVGLMITVTVPAVRKRPSDSATKARG
jgi:hypothetical protein